MRKILIVLVLSFCVMNTVSYAVVFSDDFESGGLVRWTISGRQTGRKSLAGVVNQHGNQMAYMYQDGFTEILVSKMFNYQDDLHFSFAMKTQTYSTCTDPASTFYAEAGFRFIFLDSAANTLGTVAYDACTSTYPTGIFNSVANMHYFQLSDTFAVYSLDIENVLSTITIDRSAIASVQLMFSTYNSGNSYEMNSTCWFDNVVVSVIPEPATMLLLGLGAMMLRRKK